jgi:hypothetical protein
VKFHITQDDKVFFLLLQGGTTPLVTSSHNLASLHSQVVFYQFHYLNWKNGVTHRTGLAENSICVGNNLPVGTNPKTSAFSNAGAITSKLSGLAEIVMILKTLHKQLEFF